jgi:NH3-dependent NAD+ synthetase
LAEDAATNLGTLASKNRMQSQQIHQQAVSDISGGIESTLAGIMDAFGGGG